MKHIELLKGLWQEGGKDFFEPFFNQLTPDQQTQVVWEVAQLQQQQHPLIQDGAFLDELQSLWKIRPKQPDFQFLRWPPDTGEEWTPVDTSQ